MRYFFFVCTLCVSLSGYGQSLSGTVFADGNNNGRMDRGEKVLAGVGISDGDTIVWSNRRGDYLLPSNRGRACFVITPDGYANRLRGGQNPRVVLVGEADSVCDFALCATPHSPHFRVAVVGDIQVDSEEQQGFASRTILSEISSRDDLGFWIHMGDLVNDKPQLLRRAFESASALPLPLWCVVGNHDLDLGEYPRQGTLFREVVGSDVAAFFRGKTCFVLLNNVEGEREGLAESQLRFLRHLATHCPKEMLLVVCQHTPLASVENRAEMLDVLSGHKTLILSAHAHRVFRREWTERISEVSVGAACGSWWTGERDAWGIPGAYQQCGTPRNYFVFDFSDNDYTFRFKGVGMDERIQADVWVKGEYPADNNVPELQQEPDGRIVVNVYGGEVTTTRVSYRVDNGPWQQMSPYDALAPALARMIYMNKEGGFPTKFSRRQPVRRQPSPHLWAAVLPDSLRGAPRLFHFQITDSRGLAPCCFSRMVY